MDPGENRETISEEAKTNRDVPATAAEEVVPTTTPPIMSFPSASAGSPDDFKWGTADQSSTTVDLQAERALLESGRRRNDMITYAVSQNAPWLHGTPSSRAIAFDRSDMRCIATASSRYVDEDDRIELFLSNGRADLTSAVMSSSIFSLLNAEERQHCIHLMLNSFVQIPKGCMLTQRGDKVDTLYFLVSGTLGMTDPNAGEFNTETGELVPPRNTARRRSSYDAEVPQDRYPIKLGPGAFVTPRAFVREEQTNHSIMAMRTCTLQKLSYNSFQQVISGGHRGKPLRCSRNPGEYGVKPTIY